MMEINILHFTYGNIRLIVDLNGSEKEYKAEIVSIIYTDFWKFPLYYNNKPLNITPSASLERLPYLHIS